ncbi:MAG: 6,7-dimethyl-8-ribityllumazine synthase [Gemmatimonadetes bacterium]|nr:6,7-dimethyl-8-ribityllumazine synthase [Gemmatimonadota bacterium]
MVAAKVASERPDLRVCLVVSRFNEPVTGKLLSVALECLSTAGVDRANIDVVHVPGAWELPLGVRLALGHSDYDGIVALGCIIRGETPHFEYVSMGATVGLQALARESSVPIGFGLLTTEDGDQAFARAGGDKGNKGEEAARAVLEMCDLAARLR